MDGSASEIILRIVPGVDNIPAPCRGKCLLRIALESIPVGHHAFIKDEDSVRIQKMVTRIRRKNRNIRFTVRKEKGGARVWRKV